MKMILIAFLDESEEMLQRRTHSRRLASLEEETHKVLALLVRQLFLASRDWSLARRIGSPDPRQLLEWRVVVQTLEELGELLARVAREVNRASAGFANSEPAVVATLPELRAELKRVVEGLMRPSLQLACEVYGETFRLRQGLASHLQAPSNGSSSKARSPSATHALERAVSCLMTLACVSIDRAVSLGTETVMLDGP